MKKIILYLDNHILSIVSFWISIAPIIWVIICGIMLNSYNISLDTFTNILYGFATIYLTVIFGGIIIMKIAKRYKS